MSSVFFFLLTVHTVFAQTPDVRMFHFRDEYGFSRPKNIGFDVAIIKDFKNLRPQSGFDSLVFNWGICDDILKGVQNLPLREMINKNYITPKSALEYRELYLKSYRPSQVKFFEVLDPLKGRPRSTLATIAGQFFLENPPNKAALSTSPLPWQLEKHLSSVQLDRSQFKLVYEYGRAFKGDAGDLDLLMQKAALIQLEEIHALGMGFGINDIWVSIHTLSEQLSNNYDKKYPGTKLKTELTKPGEAIFMIPLKTLFECVGAQSSSSLLSKLIDLGIDVDTAMKILIFSRETEYAELISVRGDKGYASPLSVGDFSNLRQIAMDLYLQNLNLGTEKSKLISEIIYSVPPVFPKIYHRTYDYSWDENTVEHLDKNSILVTNFDRYVNDDNESYIKKALENLINYKFMTIKDLDHNLKMLDFYRLSKANKITLTLTITNLNHYNKRALINLGFSHTKRSLIPSKGSNFKFYDNQERSKEMAHCRDSGKIYQEEALGLCDQPQIQDYYSMPFFRAIELFWRDPSAHAERFKPYSSRDHLLRDLISANQP